MASIRWFSILAVWHTAHVVLVSGDTNLPPLFTQDMNNLPLSENTPVGTVVYTLQGRDPEGLPIKYGLVGTDKFSVNADTGDVTLVQPLDREELDNLKFLVSVEDQVSGATNNVVQEPITVIVLDENDNSPTFKNSPYEVDVPEDEKVGTTILNNILVEDRDSVGDNLEVGCVANAQWPDACDIFEVVSLHSSANQYTGALVLKQPLNYNQKQFYQFHLHATDGTLNSSSPVEVKVLDVQNSPPVFEGALTTALAEDVPVRAVALVLKAKDQDRANARTIYYELITNPLDFFLLDSSTGELRTAKPLDREALPDPSSPLNLTVRASEIVDGRPLISNLTSTLATVTITIKDVNDEPPRFNAKEYQVQVLESLPIGTPLPNLDMTVTDTDVGPNSVFTLRVTQSQGAFIVEPSQATGSTPVTLRLNSTLDYEDPNQRKFILEVLAEELHTSPRLSSRVSVTVTVLDVNDNAPSFSSPVFSASVSETAPTGAFVTALVASDRDTGSYGTEGIVYQLFGNGAELFSVNNRSGEISVAPCLTPGTALCLDVETRKDYFLHYKATDDNGTGQTTVVSLQISVEDANDNPPVFTAPLYKASIDEDATKFEPELQVQARDADQSSEVRYYLAEPHSTLRLDAVSGKFSLSGALDADRDSNKLALSVYATDGVHNATCTVEITIRDVNNHAPVFDSPFYNSSVAEDAPIGTEVATVRATDMDSGINAEIKYAIQKGALEAFQLDNTTGVLTVVSQLDYDKRNTYKIQIIASDLGLPSLTGTTEVTVQVINVNDKKPMFTPQIQRAEVSADAEIGTLVHTLTAVDPDITDISQLHFELDTEKPVRAVDNNGKEVTAEAEGLGGWFAVARGGAVRVAAALQRARAAVLALPVRVRDASAPSAAAPQQADGELIIRLVDVNRHSPVFPQSQYSERLPEEQPVGTLLNVYTPSDKDSDIAYVVIDPPSPYFHIDNHTGAVRSSKRIDYETVRRIELRLVARDAGAPPREGSARVTVDVLNENDEAPVFSSAEYAATLLENAKAGALVLTVRATDADDGKFGEVRYSLDDSPASALFTVEPTTGEIRVARGARVDREVTSQLRFAVLASDGLHHVAAPIVITVEDENDNSPIFSQNVYKSTIAENLQLNPPAAILQVQAEDKDIGINGKIQYKIIHQSEPDTFRVDESTGIIYPAKPVAGDMTYHLTVTATDEFGAGSHFDTAKVDISVLSVNKHSPVFVVPAPDQHVIEIPEELARPSQVVLRVRATDADGGDNGRVSYFLRRDSDNVADSRLFSIDAVSGELRTRGFLDRETEPVHQLVLVARDNGTPAAFSTLHLLTITLQDSNDNVPYFPKEQYEFTVAENQPPGIIVGGLKAIDKDSGENGIIYYHIVEGNNEGAFTLAKTQGLIRTNVTFDREKRSEYSLTVFASNNPNLERDALNIVGDNSTQGLATVLIRILDLNDNAPVFEEAVYYAGVKHTTKINEPIISIKAKDDDLEENGTLSYMIAASNLYKFGDQKSSGSIVPSPFSITEEGMVMTAAYMSEYNQDRFVLEIIAQEVAPPYRRATTQLHLWVATSAQSVRAVLSRACGGAAAALAAVASRLARASLARLVLLVLLPPRPHVRADTLYRDWCEVQMLAVDPASNTLLEVERVLQKLDAQYDQLKDVYHAHGVETLLAAGASSKAPEGFDPALAALIALLIVLFTGIVTFIVVCSCLKHWVISPPSLQSSKADSLSRRRILEELSTTENPLWLESKLRPYEEQELTMTVFGDQPEQPPSTEQPATDDTYATIPTLGRTPAHAHYAALQDLAFQGSTFRAPSPRATPSPPPRPSAGLAVSQSW